MKSNKSILRLAKKRNSITSPVNSKSQSIRILASLALFCSLISSCQNSVPVVSNTQTPEAKQTPIAQPVSSPAKDKGKNIYPKDAIDNYVDVCARSGSTKTECLCFITKAQDFYSLDELVKINSDMVAGKPTPEGVGKILQVCNSKKTEVEAQPSNTLVVTNKTSPSEIPQTPSISSDPSSDFEILNQGDPEPIMFVKSSAEVANRRQKLISFNTRVVTKTSAAEKNYGVLSYITNCQTGELKRTGVYLYNSQSEMIGSDLKEEITNVPDDSPMGKLRDRLCKQFGF